MSDKASTQTDILLPPTHSRIAKLSGEIAMLYRTANRDYAETVVEIGRRVRDVRASLMHGDWLAWIEESAPFARGAALNYIALFEWADGHARDFQRWKSLGPSKLYAITTLEAGGLRIVRQRKRHAIPGSDRRDTLERMSVPELYRVVAALRGDLPQARAIGRVLGGYRQRVRGLLRATAEVSTRRDEIDRDDARQLHADLVEAANTLARAFRLRR